MIPESGDLHKKNCGNTTPRQLHTTPTIYQKKKKKKGGGGGKRTGQKLNRLLSPDIFENEFPPFICTKKKYWFPPFICTKAAGYLGGKFGD